MANTARDQKRLLELLELQRTLPAEIDALMHRLVTNGMTQGDLHRLSGLSRQEISRRITRQAGRPTMIEAQELTEHLSSILRAEGVEVIGTQGGSLAPHPGSIPTATVTLSSNGARTLAGLLGVPDEGGMTAVTALNVAFRNHNLYARARAGADGTVGLPSLTSEMVTALTTAIADSLS